MGRFKEIPLVGGPGYVRPSVVEAVTPRDTGGSNIETTGGLWQSPLSPREIIKILEAEEPEKRQDEDKPKAVCNVCRGEGMTRYGGCPGCGRVLTQKPQGPATPRERWDCLEILDAIDRVNQIDKLAAEHDAISDTITKLAKKKAAAIEEAACGSCGVCGAGLSGTRPFVVTRQHYAKVRTDGGVAIELSAAGYCTETHAAQGMAKTSRYSRPGDIVEVHSVRPGVTDEELRRVMGNRQGDDLGAWPAEINPAASPGFNQRSRCQMPAERPPLKSMGQLWQEKTPEERAKLCSACYGEGILGGNGETPHKCPECGGTGKRKDLAKAMTDSMEETMGLTESCPACAGSGKAVVAGQDDCNTCRGTGRLATSEAAEWRRRSTTPVRGGDVRTCPDCGGFRFAMGVPCYKCGGFGKINVAAEGVPHAAG